jgi:AcrR family transcriptional regulator
MNMSPFDAGVETSKAGLETPTAGESLAGNGAGASGGETGVPTVRPPKQERSRKTLERIASAALELLRESGLEGTTVSDIVERANTSVGSFYARFGGKDDLVRYLRDRFRDDVLRRWDARVGTVDWGAIPLDARVEAVVALLVEAFRDDWRLSRTLEGKEEKGDWWARGFRSHALGTLTSMLLIQGETLAYRDSERAVEVGYRMAAGAIRDAVEVAQQGGDDGGPDGLASLAPELARAWTAYLKTWRPGATAEVEARTPLDLDGEAVAEAEAQPEAVSAVVGTLVPESAPAPKGRTEEVDFFDPWG